MSRYGLSKGRTTSGSLVVIIDYLSIFVDKYCHPYVEL